jgi:ParB/RepB/Spo0J family partition protein
MKTKQIKKTAAKRGKLNTNSSKTAKPELSEGTREALEKGIQKSVALELIDFNPQNRKYYKQKNLESFAAVLKKQGQIHEIIVTEISGGRYKLIVGERRVKSMRIAGFDTIRANIVHVTEAQEKEIMFSENADRENSHPLDDAAWIASMQQDGYSMQEIALRLVRPLAFVYNRVKLNQLIENFREMFVEERLNLKEALQLSALSQQSQEHFFNDHCYSWKEDEYFTLENIDDVLSNYLYDLHNAPFDTKTETLIPEKGACTNCRFNSATAAVLFPEMAEQSICGDSECYGSKCTAHFTIQIMNVLAGQDPKAIIFTSYYADDMKTILKAIPQTADLPTIEYYLVNTVRVPQKPQKETYSEFNEKGGLEFFDEEGYAEAYKEYESDMQDFDLMIHSEEIQKGLFVGQKEISVTYFRKTRQGSRSAIPQQTKKQVDDAIKAETATSKLLEDEIVRMEEKKKSARTLMNEKIQLTIHKDFTTILSKPDSPCMIVDDDIIASTIIIYNQLDVNTMDEVNRVFGIDRNFELKKSYEILSGLTEQQIAYLIRRALQSQPDSKFPENLAGYCLHKHAEKWGVQTKAIEEKQIQATDEEIKRYDERIEQMKARLETMKIEAD